MRCHYCDRPLTDKEITVSQMEESGFEPCTDCLNEVYRVAYPQEEGATDPDWDDLIDGDVWVEDVHVEEDDEG